MRKPILAGLALAFTLLSACVTINVYFPAAAAEKAAEQFIGKIIEGSSDQQVPEAPPPPPEEKKPPQSSLLDLVIPAAHAADADLNIQTPAIREIQSRMKQRFDNVLAKHFASGAVGLTKDGLLAVRDAAAVPLAERAAVNQAVAEDNRDRAAVYREIAVANGHPDWESQIRSTFAKQWVEQARSGWYYQDAAGAWKRK